MLVNTTWAKRNHWVTADKSMNEKDMDMFEYNSILSQSNKCFTILTTWWHWYDDPFFSLHLSLSKSAKETIFSQPFHNEWISYVRSCLWIKKTDTFPSFRKVNTYIVHKTFATHVSNHLIFFGWTEDLSRGWAKWFAVVARTKITIFVCVCICVSSTS